MPTRRDVVLTGAGIAAVASLAPMHALHVSSASLPVHRVLFDERHAAAQAFASAARTLGASVRGVQDEVHALWQSELYPRWRQGAIAVAGMTRLSALFCLDMMARDAGMQLVYRVNHRAQGAAHVHEAFGLLSQLASHEPFAIEQERWTRQAAERVLSWTDGRQIVAASHSNISAAQLRGVDSQTLVTWLIAPVRASALS